MEDDIVICGQCGHTLSATTRYHFNDRQLHSLRANFCAEDRSSQARIHTSIDLAAAELYYHQIEMSKLKATLRRVEENAAQLRRFIEAQKSFLSPIRKLPAELLCLIFEECCEYNEIITKPMQAATLSAVCSVWRNVAVNLQSIWSWISIFYRRPEVYEDDDLSPQTTLPSSALRRLNLCLERSTGQALQISIDCGPDMERFSESEAALWDRAVESAGRWKVLSLSPTFIKRLQNSLPAHFMPSINKVILLFSRQASNEINSYGYFMGNQTSLRALDLGYVYPVEINLPWENIETLRHSKLHFRQLKGWTERLQNLRTWHVTKFVIGKSDLENSEPCNYNLPKLDRLHLGVRDGDNFQPFLNSLQVPALSWIHVFTEKSSAAWHQEAFLSMMSRSSCLIRDFHLHDIRITDDEMVECLSLMPTLKRLTVVEVQTTSHAGTITDRLLRRLIQPVGDDVHYFHEKNQQESSRALVPKLSHMKLRSFFSCSHDLLLDMIESRFSARESQRLRSNNKKTFGLKRARLIFWEHGDDFGPETLDRLEGFSRRGLQVERDRIVEIG